MDGTDNNNHASAATGICKPTPAAIYSSAQSQAAINHQIGICRAFAEAKGWSVIDCFVDDGYSGLSISRPGLDAMLSAATRTPPPFQIIIMADEARLCRDIEKFNSPFERFAERGIELWTVDGQVIRRPLGLAPVCDDTDRRSRSGIRRNIDRVKEVKLTLARLIGRQIARELNERSDRNP
ncbi:recombinase family protein [Ensifer adhaerens]|uniref:recombinase family protein n=1 Tax=Ensifer adhaerens TaxID=106592 RepID=UPI0009EF2F51